MRGLKYSIVVGFVHDLELPLLEELAPDRAILHSSSLRLNSSETCSQYVYKDEELYFEIL